MPAPELQVLEDFPDRLPALLVRELRVRVRRPLFAIALIIAQAVLLLGLIRSLTGEDDSLAIWLWPVTLLTLLLVTITASADLRGEIARGNFALLQLTGIDSRRLVRGKWVSCAAMVLITAMSFAPWFGYLGNETGINLFVQLLYLALLVFACLVYAALEIWTAAQKSKIGIILLRLGLIFLAWYLIAERSFELELLIEDLTGGSSDPISWIVLGLLLLVGSWGAWLMLDVAATSLASEADDPLAIHRRVVLWTSLGLLALGGLWLVLAERRDPSAPTSPYSFLTAIALSLVLLPGAFALLPERPPRSVIPYRSNLFGRAGWFALPLAPGFLGATSLILIGLGCLALLLVGIEATGTEMHPSVFGTPFSALTMLGLTALAVLFAASTVRLRASHRDGRHYALLLVLWITIGLAMVMAMLALYEPEARGVTARRQNLFIAGVAVFAFVGIAVLFFLAARRDLILLRTLRLRARQTLTSDAAPTTTAAQP